MFYVAGPVKEAALAELLEITQEELETELETISKQFAVSGVRVVRHAGTVMFATAPECSEILEKMIELERESTLGRGSLETLSIIAYKGPVSKKEIEYIRGVNCDYAIRTLLLRGLIEKDQLALYTVTSDTVLHLGLQNISDLPEYDTVQKELEVGQVTEDTAGDTEEDIPQNTTESDGE